MSELEVGGIVVIAVAVVNILGRVFDRVLRNGNPGHFTPSDREKHDRAVFLIDRIEERSAKTEAILRRHVDRFDEHLRDFRCLAHDRASRKED